MFVSNHVERESERNKKGKGELGPKAENVVPQEKRRIRLFLINFNTENVAT